MQQNIQSERLAAIGHALAALSHDFKGVLNGLSGASRHLGKLVSDLAEGIPVDGEKIKKWWSLLRCNEKRLANLVEDIVEFSRVREPMLESCQLNQLLQELVAQRQEALRQRDAEITLDLEPMFPLLQLDSLRFSRAIENLLDNASDALDVQTGRICIRTRTGAECAIVEIEDNGGGIAPEHLGRIFDPFFTTKKGARGTGFGLANVKKIVEEHGGVISVRSQPGLGSCFRIELPLATVALENAGQPAMQDAASKKS